jgi:uncharacterized protein (TIGR03435 family)
LDGKQTLEESKVKNTFVFWVMATACSAQTFEVASITRLSDPSSVKSDSRLLEPTILRIHGATLSATLQWAYDMQVFEVVGPSWIAYRPSNDMPRFDIEGHFPASTPVDRVKLMLQNLLKERMGFQAHFETRVMNAYVARPADGGLKVTMMPLGESAPGDQHPIPTSKRIGSTQVEITVHDSTMKELLGEIARNMDAPLVDASGLKEERFSGIMRVQIDPQTLHADAQVKAREMTNALMLGFRDLGLNIKTEKVPLRVLVVDSANPDPKRN